MKFSLLKGWHIWVLPPGQATVRKIHLSFFRLALMALIFGGLSGGILFVSTDYGRIALLKAKSQLWLRMVQSERDRVQEENKSLQAKIDALKTANLSVLSYERKVKERLDKLAGILKSSTTLALEGDVKSNKKALALKSNSSVEAPTIGPRELQPGMGGPEYDCDSLKDGECGSVSGISYHAGDLADDIAGLVERSRIPNSDGDLVGLLDQYISLVNSVPFSLPSNGNKSSGYGMRVSPFHVGIKLHKGIDFSAPKGSPVVSTGDGRVEAVSRNSTYGFYVDIRHSGRLVTRYAHISKALVQPGQNIHRGQEIALVGSTGRSTGPHLHYEVRVDGTPHNPSSFMALADKLGSAL